MKSKLLKRKNLTYTDESLPKPVLMIQSLGTTVQIRDLGNLEIKDWRIAHVKRAISDLLTMIIHVRKLLNDKFSIKVGVIDWLNEAEEVFKNVLKYISNEENLFTVATDYGYDNHEILDCIEELLQNCWSEDKRIVLKIIDKHPKTSGSYLAVRLIDFWIQEIVNRGFFIHGLLQGSIVCDDAEEIFQILDEIRYPFI